MNTSSDNSSGKEPGLFKTFDLPLASHPIFKLSLRVKSQKQVAL